jgi:putative glutamine amidotransferase
MRPLIGIPCHAGERPARPGENTGVERSIYYNNRSYIQAVERAGGVPILIPILSDLSGLQVLLPRLDGLLLSGGLDVDPRHYHEDPHPMLGETNPQLDDLELALARWALQNDVPTLGICRGMQVLNVALGGSLYQDLADQFPNSLKHPNWDLPRGQFVHRVYVEPNSLLAEILGTREVRVNSLHHQAAKRPGNGIQITGHADDGVAELLEVSGHRFMMGAQCHPEEIYNEEPAWQRLFLAFIDSCSQSVMRQIESVQQALSNVSVNAIV